MKKLLLIIGFVALTGFAFSQAKIDQNFNSELPGTWTIIDNNSDNNSWYYEDGGYGINGTNCISIDTYPDAGDDYIVAPQITVNDGDLLTFYASSSDADYKDDFTVYVSQTGTNATNFTITLGSQTAVPTDWTKYEYDLTANANISDGDQIYIAIYCNSNGSYLNVDNFRVGPAVELINEEFESGIPGTWTLVDGGSNPNTWTDTLKAGMDSTNGVWVDTYQDGYGPADDWLITPQFKARAGDVISFWLYGNDPDYEDTVYVNISKTTTSTADFTIHIDTIYTVTDWTKYQYNMDDISGITASDDIYVGIQAKSNGSRVFLDRFRIGEYIPPALIDAYAVSQNEVAFVYDAALTENDITIGDFTLSGSDDLTFSDFTISNVDNKIAIATTSANMSSDKTLDLLSNSVTGEEVQFYAGITSIEYLSLTNPNGTIEAGYNATFSGIVSATNNDDRLWLADASGAHHGINTYGLATGDVTVNIGDEVVLYGEISPYRNQTEIYPAKLIDVLSTGNDVYAATTITGADIDTSIVADTDPAEKYEGSLVKVLKAEAIDTITVDGNFYWMFSDDAGTSIFYVGSVFDFISFDETLFTKGEEYDITGIITGRDNVYVLNPRDGSDLSETLGVDNIYNFANNIKVYPNPVENILYVNNLESIDKIRVINVIGQELFSVDATNKTNVNIDLSSLRTGIYFVTVTRGDKSKAYKIMKK